MSARFFFSGGYGYRDANVAQRNERPGSGLPVLGEKWESIGGKKGPSYDIEHANFMAKRRRRADENKRIKKKGKIPKKKGIPPIKIIIPKKKGIQEKIIILKKRCPKCDKEFMRLKSSENPSLYCTRCHNETKVYKTMEQRRAAGAPAHD